jgi:asparagine N-glycosylation enzyme membrane subunit Stt3
VYNYNNETVNQVLLIAGVIAGVITVIIIIFLIFKAKGKRANKI